MHTVRMLTLAAAMTGMAGCDTGQRQVETDLRIAEDEIYHLGFVVEDLAAAIDHWAGDHGVGPFFVAHDFEFRNPDYRGRPLAPRVDLAFAFNGRLMIELIEQVDDTPSVYRELVAESGYGFHHLGYLRRDLEASIRAAEEMGHACIFRAGFEGGSLVYCRPGDALGAGAIEYVQRTEGVEALLDMMYRAALAWDGSEAVRNLR